MALCIVSAFLDIGRNKWSTFKRSIDQYFNNFQPYVLMEHNMIVFIDEQHEERLKQLCKNNTKIKLIPINEEWMMNNIYAYRQLSREREIMESENFKRLVSHRLNHPECSKPEYNIIQHSKIDFICHVINNKLIDADYYAWSDFGYFQHPSRIPRKDLDINKFDLNKINFQAMNTLSEQDYNINYTLVNAPERIGGFFYLGNAENLLIYQDLYHKICKQFHDIGIVDDDQHIMIQSIFRMPSLFKVWNLHGWHLVYNYFQLTS